MPRLDDPIPQSINVRHLQDLYTVFSPRLHVSNVGPILRVDMVNHGARFVPRRLLAVSLTVLVAVLADELPVLRAKNLNRPVALSIGVLTARQHF
ncbi:hypothetical protein D3C75_897450 [compost metagenome]